MKNEKRREEELFDVAKQAKQAKCSSFFLSFYFISSIYLLSMYYIFIPAPFGIAIACRSVAVSQQQNRTEQENSWMVMVMIYKVKETKQASKQHSKKVPTNNDALKLCYYLKNTKFCVPMRLLLQSVKSAG